MSQLLSLSVSYSSPSPLSFSPLFHTDQTAALCSFPPFFFTVHSLWSISPPPTFQSPSFRFLHFSRVSSLKPQLFYLSLSPFSPSLAYPHFLPLYHCMFKESQKRVGWNRKEGEKRREGKRRKTWEENTGSTCSPGFLFSSPCSSPSRCLCFLSVTNVKACRPAASPSSSSSSAYYYDFHYKIPKSALCYISSLFLKIIHFAYSGNFFVLFSSKNQPATLRCKDYGDGDVAESGWEDDSCRQMKRSAFTCILFQRCIKGIFYYMYVYIIYDFQQWGCFNSKLISCHSQRSPTESFSHTCGTALEMEISIAFLAIMNRRIAMKFSTDI